MRLLNRLANNNNFHYYHDNAYKYLAYLDKELSTFIDSYRVNHGIIHREAYRYAFDSNVNNRCTNIIRTNNYDIRVNSVAGFVVEIDIEDLIKNGFLDRTIEIFLRETHYFDEDLFNNVIRSDYIYYVGESIYRNIYETKVELFMSLNNMLIKSFRKIEMSKELGIELFSKDLEELYNCSYKI